MSASTITNTSKAFELKVAQEFKKPLLHNIDPTFILTLLIVLVLEAVLVTFMARRPVKEFSEQEIAIIQERFANFVLGEDFIPKEDVSTLSSGAAATGEEATAEEGETGAGSESETGDDTEGSGSGEGFGEGVDSQQMRRVSSQEAIRQSQERVSQEISNKGILGLLTGTGTAAEGQAVSSGLFTQSGSGAGSSDLDDVLASVNGLKSGGGSGLGGNGTGNGVGSVKGGRSSKQAGIDDLVSDLGSASSGSISRKGEVMVEAPSELVGRGSRSAYRSPEAIQEVLLEHNSAIRYCYERELKRNPNLKGKLSVRITVGADGHVTKAEIVNSTLNNARVERCILARIRLWKDFHPIDSGEGEITFRQIYAFGY